LGRGLTGTNHDDARAHAGCRLVSLVWFTGSMGRNIRSLLRH
jgi:hypothetical protein